MSHENTVYALKRTFTAVHATLEQEAADGEALAYGLCKEIEKPRFLLFLSNILAILGNLLRTFQLAHFNLVTVDQLITGTIAQLNAIKDDVLHTGYMMNLNETMQSINVTDHLDEDSFVKNATSYLNAVIANLQNRFPQIRILRLLGYFQPENVYSATPLSMLEIGEFLQMDGPKLWLEFAGYKSFVEALPEPHSLLSTIHAMYIMQNKEALQTTFPLISDVLAHIAVLPASSSEAKRLFSAMKRVKSSLRNRLTTTKLDHLLRVSIEGPTIDKWDPYPAMRKWESMGNRKINKSSATDD